MLSSSIIIIWPHTHTDRQVKHIQHFTLLQTLFLGGLKATTTSSFIYIFLKTQIRVYRAS